MPSKIFLHFAKLGCYTLPSRNIGGESVGKVLIAGLLSKLDAGAPYNGWIF
jgi:hypothetical protein